MNTKLLTVALVGALVLGMGFLSDEMIPEAHALEDETIVASGNWGTEGLTYEITDTGILRILGHSSSGSSPTSTYPAKWASFRFHVLDMSGCDITTIQTNVFGNADYFSNVTELILPNTLTTITGNNFIKMAGLKKITGPIELNWTGTASASVTSWRNCKHVEEIHFTKGSTGEGFDYVDVAYSGQYTRTPWYYSRANLVKVTFDDDITYLGANMFRNGNIIYYPPASLENTGENCFLNCNIVQTSGAFGSDGLMFKYTQDGTLKIYGTSATGLVPTSLPSEWENLNITNVDMSEAVVSVCSFTWGSAFANVTEFIAPETTSATMITFANSTDGASLKSIEGPISSSWVFTNMGDDVVVENVHLTAGTTSGMSPDYSDSYYQLTPWHNTARFQAVNLTLDEGIVRLGANMFRDGHIATYAPPSTLTTIGDNCFLNCVIDQQSDDSWGTDGLKYSVSGAILYIIGHSSTGTTPSTTLPYWDTLDITMLDMSECDVTFVNFAWSEAFASKIQNWILPDTAINCIPNFPSDNTVLQGLAGPVSMDWSDEGWAKVKSLNFIHFKEGTGIAQDYSTTVSSGLYYKNTPWAENACTITSDEDIRYLGTNMFRNATIISWYEPENVTPGANCYLNTVFTDEGRISLRLNISPNWSNGHTAQPIYKITFYGTSGYNYDGSTRDTVPWNSSTLPSVDIVFEYGIQSIGTYMFADSDAKVKFPNGFPNSLTAIGESAFSNSRFAMDDHSLKLPASVNYIGAYAFESTELTYVYIKNTGAMDIGVGAFQFNDIIRIVVLSELLDIIPDTTDYGSIASNPQCRVIHFTDENFYGYAGAGCQFHTTGTGTNHTLAISGDVEGLTWGEGVYRLPWDMLLPHAISKLDLTGVTSASIPMYLCLDNNEMPNLKEIDLGQNITTFTHFCENAPALMKVTFSGNAVMDGAFASSPALTQFIIYGSPTDLTEATSADLPWARSADCEVTIIAGDFIGSYQFRGFAGTINLVGDVEYVHPYAFMNADFTEFDMSKFKNIQAHAFDGAGLEVLHLPASVQTIGDYAFANCTALAKVYFDPGCTASLGHNVFDRCTVLTSVFIDGEVSVQEDTWDGTHVKYVTSTISTIAPVPNSSDFGNILLGDKKALMNYFDRVHPENSHGYIGHSLIWQNSLDEQGRLVRTIEGEIDASNPYYDYDYLDYEEQYTLYKIVANYVFPDNWEIEEMFNVSLPVLEEVEFGSKWVGRLNNSFPDTPNLRVITINSSMQFYGTCFGNAENSIETVNIVKGDGSLKASWTEGVPWKMTTRTIAVNVVDGVTQFPRGLFQNSQATVEEIYFPASVNHIGYNAFQNMPNLKSAVFANPSISVDARVFYGCTGLDYLEITEGMSIGLQAFHNAGLKAVVFLGEPASIDATAFEGCTVEKILNLTSLDIVAGSSDFGGIASNPEVRVDSGFDSSFMIEEIGEAPPAPPISDLYKMLLMIIPILIILAVVYIVGRKVF